MIRIGNYYYCMYYYYYYYYYYFCVFNQAFTERRSIQVRPGPRMPSTEQSLGMLVREFFTGRITFLSPNRQFRNIGRV